MKSVDKLRDCTWIGSGKVNEYLDEIEAEIAETEAFCKRVEEAARNNDELDVFGVAYMPLPVDADGVPIRVGDKMEYCGLTFDAFSVAEDVVFSKCDFKNGRYTVDVYDHSDVRHVKPCTLEDVLREFAGDYRRAMNAFEEGDEYGPSITELTARCAAEIRELLGGDAE